MFGPLSNGSSVIITETVNLIYRKKTDFYFANANGFFAVAKKEKLLRLYPDKKNIMYSYLKQHAVDFNNEVSLQNLFTAITEIQ